MSNVFTATVADPFGRALADIEPVLGPVSWVLNGVGGCNIRMATNHATWIEDNFRLGGGMLFLAFDNGLPNWAGFAVRRQWLAGGVAQVDYRSAESLFAWRLTGKNEQYTASPGVIMQNVLTNANGQADTNIVPLEIWEGGGSQTLTYHYETLEKAFAALRNASASDWHVEAEMVKGKIALSLNFYARLGVDKNYLALLEGVNLHQVTYTEQDTGLRNKWFVVGGGSTWDDDRPVGTAQDDDSIEVNGLREGVKIINGLTDLESLTNQAQALLAKSLYPYRVITGQAQNINPAPFADYTVGDRVQVIANSTGFNGVDELARITAREYIPSSGQCKLALELDTATYD